MIKIEEKLSKKIPGGTSLFISFNYSQPIVDIVKNFTTVRAYDSSSKVWEVPITDLHTLLDKFAQLKETVELICMDEEDEKKVVDYEIGPFKSSPFKHQEDAIQWGLNNDCGLLLDAPGLGKTLQTIYIAQERKKHFGIKHCLIVCGVNTLKSNWKNEILKHSELSARILGERVNTKGRTVYGGTKERLEDLRNPIEEFFVITNIETMRQDDIIKELTKKNPKNQFDMIVLDEFHHCKNPSAQQTKNFLKLKSKYKLGLTGTLLTNSPLDCYTALKWIEMETSTFTNFKYYYCNFAGAFNNILIGYRNIDVLQNQLKECSLRRTKNLLDLPPKNIIVEEVEMLDDQRTFYNNVVDGVIDQVDKVELNAANMLSLTTRLRQATACPNILTTEKISSAKIDRCCDLARQIIENGDKVVIFSVFKETLKVLSEELREFNPLVCTGDVKDTIISENINEFQENAECKLILCTTAKMGTGVTLNSASYAIFIDTPWTAADYLQCQDRIHRIGSKDPVFIYSLVTKDTIDTHVRDIVDDKELISDYVIDGKLPSKVTDRMKKMLIDLQKNSFMRN